LAGKGSLCERGLRPLSFTFPLSNRFTYALIQSYWFERGIKGVSKNEVRPKCMKDRKDVNTEAG
jgi:hypothetical protein